MRSRQEIRLISLTICALVSSLLALGLYGQVILTGRGSISGTAILGFLGGGGGSPGGTTGSVQYNAGGGNLGGDAYFTTDGNGNVTATSFTVVGAGSGYTQWTSGALTAGAVGTVKCGASNTSIFSCSDNAGSVTPMAMIAGDIGGAQGTEQIIGLHLTHEGILGNQTLTTTVGNDSTTGTTVNLLAKLTSTGALLIGTGDTATRALICIANCGIEGNSNLAVNGQAACVMDSSVSSTEGYEVVASTTTAGRCHAVSAAGAGRWVIGTMVDNATSPGVNGNILIGGYLHP